MKRRLVAGLLALAWSGCSHDFLVLEAREPDADEPGRDGRADASIALDASRALDARLEDTNSPPPADATLPAPDGNLGARVVSGFAQTCAIVNGTLYCWGADDFGQVGVLGDSDQTRPVKLSDDAFIDVCAGEHHSCALRADGTLLCWGANTHGELGLGDSSSREIPTPLDSRRFVAVSCGGSSTCALAPRGELWCWGDNTEGKLGQADPPKEEPGTLAMSEVPIQVRSELRFAKVSVGQGHVCAISEQGSLYCWGRNDQGQLGIGGTLEQTRTPLPVIGDLQYAAISAGQFHSCAVDMSGKLWCWGKNEGGMLGLGSSQAAFREPALLQGSNYESVSVNWLHSCAVTTNGTLSCWGRGVEGQLGGGDDKNRDRPTQVVGRWRSINAGQFHSCAFNDSGLSCWGANNTGQLGLGDYARYYIPSQVGF